MSDYERDPDDVEDSDDNYQSYAEWSEKPLFGDEDVDR